MGLTLGDLIQETGEPLSLPREAKHVIPMPSVKTSPIGHKMELFGDEHDALASAAHELKTPLAIMGGYLQLLLAQKL